MSVRLKRKKNELLSITSCVMSESSEKDEKRTAVNNIVSVHLKRKKNELLSITSCVMSESSEKEEKRTAADNIVCYVGSSKKEEKRTAVNNIVIVAYVGIIWKGWKTNCCQKHVLCRNCRERNEKYLLSVTSCVMSESSEKEEKRPVFNSFVCYFGIVGKGRKTTCCQ